MSNDKTLLDQIDDLVASKTFSLEALEGIKGLKDSLKKTLEDRDSLQRRYDGLYDANCKQSDELLRKSNEIAELKAEVNARREAAQKGYDAVWEKKIAEASAAAYKDAMAMVFKPNAVRETVQRNVMKPVDGHPGGNGSYPTAGYLASGTESESVTREDA